MSDTSPELTSNSVSDSTTATPPPASPDNASPVLSSQPSPHKYKHGWFFKLSLLLLLISIGLFNYYLWQQLTDLQQQTQQIIPLNQQITVLQGELTKVQTNQQQNVQKREGLEAQLATSLEQVQRIDNNLFTLNKIVSQLSEPQNNPDWLLAEITYLLNIAQHRLLLAQDPDGALAALTAADQRLRPIQSPIILQVRTQLAKDINKLRELERPDFTGLAVRLANYAVQAEELPLLQGKRQTTVALPSPTPTPNKIEHWEDALSVIWGEVQKLVVVRYNTEATVGLLTPEQRYFVVQALRLKLETARFTLLRRDGQNFGMSIQAVRAWLNRYYDQNDNAIKTLQVDLDKMQRVVLNPPLPDISGTLAILQHSPNTTPSSHEAAKP